MIHPGAQLIINCQVFFTPDARIIVQPGGQLTLEGTYNEPARLTSGCNKLWRGIEIHGDPAMPQDTNQGKVKIANGIIENSVCGIRTGNPDFTPEGSGYGEPFPVYPSGGIIEATAATFRNNITGVEFHPYRYFENGIPVPNKSFFKACTFETTKPLLDSFEPKELLKLSGINQLKVQGCVFRNSENGAIQGEERGTGIFCNNAQLALDTLKRLFGLTVNLPNRFDSLYYGIYSLHSGQGLTSLKVHSCEFNDNKRSLYASGFTQLTLLEVDSSQFSYLNPLASDDVYLLYLNNCTGFKVHQNSFTGNINQNIDQYGVIVNNSGIDNNYIYDNYFEGLTYGIQGLNINGNSDVPIEGGVPVFIPTGLRFICNKFHDVGCTNDFLINENMPFPPTRPGIAYNQRNASNTTNPTQEPAGNVFTSSHTLANTNDYDINISSSVGDILYTHHTLYPTGLRLEPNDNSNPKVLSDPRPDVGYYDENSSCPNDFYPEGNRTELRSALYEASQKIDSLISLLQILVDEGSTDTMKSSVENSSTGQSYEVYEELMSGSPYLSDTVMKASIEKEDVLPNAMIRDIMVANPHSAKNEELLDAIDQRNDPMPDSMWVEILEGIDTVGAMERLIGELDGWIQKRDLCFHALAELFLIDTINEWSPDSLINLLDSDEQLSSHYLLVQYYLNHFTFSEAVSELQNIFSQFNLNDRQSATHQKILSLVSVLPALFTDTTGFLIPDSLQKQTLEQIAEADHDLPGAWARNILIASGLVNYHEPIVNESTLKSSRKGKYHWTRSRTIDSEIKVFPNPAKDFIIVEYKKSSALDHVHIVFIDAKGIKLRSYLFLKKENQTIIPIHDLPSGIYLIQLLVNGITKESCKIIIIR